MAERYDASMDDDRSVDEPSVDADESGALAIALALAVVAIVALMTFALVISIP